MMGLPITTACLGCIIVLTELKIPLWLIYIITVLVALIMVCCFAIEFFIAKRRFKYEVAFKKKYEDTTKVKQWLDEHIGSKNYITLIAINETDKTFSIDLLNLEANIRFKTEEDMIHFILAWSGWND